MLKYLYNLDYDDTGDAASIAPYMLDETSVNVAEVSEQLTETQAALHSRLLNNITVYAIADKYDIPQLKMSAQEKVKTWISKHELSQDLPLIIDAIFSTTPSSDEGLRLVATTFCNEHDLALLRKGRLPCLLSNHGDLGLGMVLELIQSREKDKRSSKTRSKEWRNQMVLVGSSLDIIAYNANEVISLLDGKHYPDARLYMTILQDQVKIAKGDLEKKTLGGR